jgi:hypothetical protein
MDATEDLSIGLHAVADHPALAVRANRCERVDCAFEAIEGVMLTSNDHLKRLVVFIFANFACSHTQMVRAPSPLRRCSLLSLRARSLWHRPDPWLCKLPLVSRGSCQLPLQLQLLRSRDSAGKVIVSIWSRSCKYQNSLSIV